MSAANPYAAPGARVADPVDTRAAESTRRAHIAHETVVRAVAWLGIVGGALMLLRAAWILAFDWTIRLSLIPIAPLIFPFLLVTGALSVAAGMGLLRLLAWARVLAVALCFVGIAVASYQALIGLKVAPVGALISVCFLYVLLSPKSRRLFAADYADVIAATPHTRYCASMLLWIVLALVGPASGALIAFGP